MESLVDCCLLRNINETEPQREEIPQTRRIVKCFSSLSFNPITLQNENTSLNLPGFRENDGNTEDLKQLKSHYKSQILLEKQGKVFTSDKLKNKPQEIYDKYYRNKINEIDDPKIESDYPSYLHPEKETQMNESFMGRHPVKSPIKNVFTSPEISLQTSLTSGYSQYQEEHKLSSSQLIKKKVMKARSILKNNLECKPTENSHQQFKKVNFDLRTCFPEISVQRKKSDRLVAHSTYKNCIPERDIENNQLAKDVITSKLHDTKEGITPNQCEEIEENSSEKINNLDKSSLKKKALGLHFQGHSKLNISKITKPLVKKQLKEYPEFDRKQNELSSRKTPKSLRRRRKSLHIINPQATDAKLDKIKQQETEEKQVGAKNVLMNSRNKSNKDQNVSIVEHLVASEADLTTFFQILLTATYLNENSAPESTNESLINNVKREIKTINKISNKINGKYSNKDVTFEENYRKKDFSGENSSKISSSDSLMSTNSAITDVSSEPSSIRTETIQHKIPLNENKLKTFPDKASKSPEKKISAYKRIQSTKTKEKKHSSQRIPSEKQDSDTTYFLSQIKRINNLVEELAQKIDKIENKSEQIEHTNTQFLNKASETEICEKELIKADKIKEQDEIIIPKAESKDGIQISPHAETGYLKNNHKEISVQTEISNDIIMSPEQRAQNNDGEEKVDHTRYSQSLDSVFIKFLKEYNSFDNKSMQDLFLKNDMNAALNPFTTLPNQIDKLALEIMLRNLIKQTTTVKLTSPSMYESMRNRSKTQRHFSLSQLKENSLRDLSETVQKTFSNFRGCLAKFLQQNKKKYSITKIKLNVEQTDEIRSNGSKIPMRILDILFPFCNPTEGCSSNEKFKKRKHSRKISKVQSDNENVNNEEITDIPSKTGFHYKTWSNIRRTKYANGTIHFGPLMQMPEPILSHSDPSKNEQFIPTELIQEFKDILNDSGILAKYSNNDVQLCINTSYEEINNEDVS